MATVDAYLTPTGDIARGPDGDIAVTTTPYRDDIQQIYLRVMTDIGDFTLYPQMGADLSRLYGMPQSQSTGQTGITLISSALDRELRFKGRTYNVNAVPTGQQVIRFDIALTSQTGQLVQISVQQKLAAQ